VDGLGELAGAPGAAAELSEDVPVFELGVRALAGCAEFGVGAVGLLLGFRLVLPAVRDLRVRASLVTLVGQGDQPGSLQLGQHVPDPLGLLVVYRSGQCPGDPQDAAVRAGDDLQVHPVPLVLAGVEGPVGGDPVDRDQRPVQDHIGIPGPLRLPDRLAEFRRPGGEEGDGLGHVSPGRGHADPEPGRQPGERLAFAQVDQDQERLLPGVQLAPQRPDAGPMTADDPGHEVQGLAGQRQRGTVKQHGTPLVVVMKRVLVD
jgi:hypothetical protein